jgi:hypothetical protein
MLRIIEHDVAAPIALSSDSEDECVTSQCKKSKTSKGATVVSPHEDDVPLGVDEDDVPLGVLAKKAAVKRTTEVRTEPPAHMPKKHKNVSGHAVASTEQHSTAESGQVSPESPTKLPAEQAPVKEASQAAVEKAARAVPPTDQVATEPAESTPELAVTDVPAEEGAADAAAAKLDAAQAAAEHKQQAAAEESMPVSTAEAGQVIATDTNNELPHGTGQAAAEHTGKVTTDQGEILARARARVSQAEHIAAGRAAAKLAAKAKAAEEAKAKAAAEAEALAKAAEEAKLAEEAKAKEEEAKAKEEEAKAKAAEEAKAKVDELKATILDLSSQCGNAAHAKQTCERDLAESKRQLTERSGSIESARENINIKSAAAASSRQKHAESIEAHAAAVNAACELSYQFDLLFSNFDATSLSVTIEDKKLELAGMDADAGEEAEWLKAEIANLEATLVDGNALHSMLTSMKADVRDKLGCVAAALARADQDEEAENQAREFAQKLAHEHASLQAVVVEGSTSLKDALDAEIALTSQLNEARLAVEAKVAELNALNAARQAVEVAVLSAPPASSESSASAPGVVAVGTGSPASETPRTPMFPYEDDAADYEEGELAAEMQSPTPQPHGPSVSFASSLLNTIDTGGHRDVIAAFCLEMRNKNPTRDECADALEKLLGHDVRLAFNEVLDNKVAAERRKAKGGRSLVAFCHGVNEAHSIDETFAVRAANAEMELPAAIDMKEHLSAVFTVLGQSDFLPLVMPARTQGKFVIVIFSRDNGPNAFDAVDAKQLHEFILHVRVGLAKCKRTNLVFSDLTWRNICWSFWLITNIDLDESAFNRHLGALQSFLSAFSMLFTGQPALFDDVLENLVMSDISQRLRAPAQALVLTGCTVNGPLAAPLANSIGGFRAPFRLGLIDAVNDKALQKFIQRSVFFLLTHMSNFINDSSYPFSRSACFLVSHAPSQRRKPPSAQVHQGRWRSNPPQPQEDQRQPPPAFQVLERRSSRER